MGIRGVKARKLEFNGVDDEANVLDELHRIATRVRETATRFQNEAQRLDAMRAWFLDKFRTAKKKGRRK